MRVHARVWFLAMVCGVLLAGVLPAAAQAASGIENFFASNCKVNTCKHTVGETAAEEKAHAIAEGFTQAEGHPNFGITDFKINTEGAFPNAAPAEAGAGAIVTHIRTDVAPGVATNPEAPLKCSFEEFGKEFEPAPGAHTGLYEAPTCKAESELGVNQAVVWLGPKPSPEGGDLPLEGNVYNLLQPKGLASDFGVALKLPKPLTEALLKIPTPQLYAHTLIEGSVEWGAEAEGTGKADYHDYFEINVSPSLPLISSRLIFNGRAGQAGVGDFLTNPSSCTGTGPQTTTNLKLKFANGSSSNAAYSPPIGTENCGLVPFEPGFALAQPNKASDATDGITAEVSSQHHRGATEIDYSQVKTASVVLPPGITLNPSSAAGLEACTPEQIGIGTKRAIACPEGSQIGTVTLNVPGLPPESLKGNVYLGGPPTGPITAPPYVIYVAATSERYAVTVRLRGVTTPNPLTGQLTTTFTENPEQPFNSLVMHFNTGTLSPLANSLKCEASTATTTFTPYTLGESKSPLANFEVTGCTSTFPFAPTQAVSSEPATGGASTNFNLTFTRPQGNQYLAAVRNVLPAGVVGLIPTVTECAEAQANAGTCTSASQIGTATVQAGSGSPFSFHGKVYLTGPYQGAPYGLSIAVEAAGGPFDLGPVVARVKLEVDPHTAQVIATDSTIPSIVGGIPTRIRALTVSINRQGFERNPTNCGVLSTVTTLTGSFGAVATLSTPFQVEGCSSLAFAPKFTAGTSAKASRSKGASLTTTLTQGSGQANIKTVKVELPKQLPSRLSTLQKACTEAQFNANPLSCPAASKVGTATVITPTLPGKMTGPAIFVSHGGASFPDLDLVLEDKGVRVILTGNTDIKKGITTSTFASTPDVPVTSVTVSLPTATNSALGAFGDLCRNPLVMPTTITGQNGKITKKNTIISVSGCGVKVVGHKVIGHTAYLTVKTFAAGRITASGRGAKTVRRSLGAASKAATLKVPLTRHGKIKIRVGFVPKKKGAHSSSSVTVTFR
jgi:hypothetical protein